MAHIPPRLPPGGTIGVVTPSAEINWAPTEDPRRELERGLAYLRDLGFQIKMGAHALAEGPFGAGSPEERAEDINNMFADPAVDAIISTHGGVFANATLPYLDYDLMQRNPKILMGFSDVATLHLAIYARAQVVTFHGNMVMFYFGMEPQPYDREAFLDRLVHGQIGAVAKNQPWKTVRGSSSVEGVLLGGNPMVMRWLLGTPYWPDFDDAILFMEVPGFAHDIFYNMLVQFRQAGLFERINGLLLGHSRPHEGFTAADVLLEVTADYDFPVVRTDDFGHTCPNTVLPVGIRARLEAETASLILLEACVR
ncbi:MAG: LD-carboxypeptidase [Candidatus Promineifilaceae bacterium]|nr:LD-carboxypeptidase [Candidatus Promineifilaceae bacterium]